MSPSPRKSREDGEEEPQEQNPDQPDENLVDQPDENLVEMEENEDEEDEDEMDPEGITIHILQESRDFRFSFLGRLILTLEMILNF